MTPANEPAGRVLDALGNQTRREILAFLRESPLPVGSIATRLPISRPAVSKHLRILEEAGLVMYNENGARNIFSLRPAGFREARAYLDLFWDEALVNFQRMIAESGASET